MASIGRQAFGLSFRLFQTPTARAISRTYFSSSIPYSASNHLLLRPRILRPSFFSPRFSLRSRTTPPRIVQQSRFNSTKVGPPEEKEPTSLSARLKKLSREYGYAALGVYLGLTALDFPFCFLAVRYLGTERIGHWEERAIAWVKRTIPVEQLAFWRKKMDPATTAVGGGTGEEVHVLSDLEEAEIEATKEGASIWTELALAYAIHKSFIFVRVPLTAAITPKVVRVLRGWGWNIGKKGGVKEGVRAKIGRKMDD